MTHFSSSVNHCQFSLSCALSVTGKQHCGETARPGLKCPIEGDTSQCIKRHMGDKMLLFEYDMQLLPSPVISDCGF